jgi:hypothetical protein
VTADRRPASAIGNDAHPRKPAKPARSEPKASEGRPLQGKPAEPARSEPEASEGRPLQGKPAEPARSEPEASEGGPRKASRRSRRAAG